MAEPTSVLVSPFRFAGGKSWLTGRLRWWLLSREHPIRLLVEPFAGVASVSLAAVGMRLTPRALLIERDDDVAAVWQSVLGADATGLAARVLSFDVRPDTVAELLNAEPRSTLDRAFRALVRNPRQPRRRDGTGQRAAPPR